jgi:hypothetical protein
LVCQEIEWGDMERLVLGCANEQASTLFSTVTS